MRIDKKTVGILSVFLGFESWFMYRTLDRELYFAFFGFIALSIFIYNIFGVARTGEGTTGKGYGLYAELIDRIRNPKTNYREVLPGLDMLNISFLIIAIINFILSALN